MSAQLFDKNGNSKIVENNKVQQHLGMGWTFNKPIEVVKPNPRSKKTMVQPSSKQTSAEATILKAEATADVINTTKKEK
jgi:hypothetical protein